MTFSLARRQLGTANRYLIGGGLCLLLGLSTTAEQTLLFNKWLLGADSYRLEEHVSGTIRVQGYGGGEKDSTANLIRYWEEGFAKFHPNIRFENHLKGSASALAGLYTQTGGLPLQAVRRRSCCHQPRRTARRFCPGCPRSQRQSYLPTDADTARRYFRQRASTRFDEHPHLGRIGTPRRMEREVDSGLRTRHQKPKLHPLLRTIGDEWQPQMELHYAGVPLGSEL